MTKGVENDGNLLLGIMCNKKFYIFTVWQFYYFKLSTLHNK